MIPRLLGGENLVMAASTGSGKTLAFALPAIQSLLAQEADGYERQPRRPRCVILVPTRELARQILAAIKSLAHFSKVRRSHRHRAIMPSCHRDIVPSCHHAVVPSCYRLCHRCCAPAPSCHCDTAPPPQNGFDIPPYPTP